MSPISIGALSSGRYGPGDTSGLNLDANVVIPLPKNLYIRGEVNFRRYSTTFTALRQARHEHVLRRNGELRDRSCDVRRWHYSGSGYRTPGDAWLAESGRKRAVEQRRVAREELRTNPLEGRRR